MDILAIYPKLDVNRPVGMDVNRLIFLEKLSGENNIDVWIPANGPDCSQEEFFNEFGVNVVDSNPSTMGQSEILGRSLLAEYSPLHKTTALSSTSEKLETQEYDIIHIETAGLAPLVKKFSDTPVVWSLVDSPSFRKKRLYKYNSRSVRGFKQYLEYKTAQRVESRYSSYADVLHVVSEQEAEYLNARYPGVQTHDIPIALPDKFTDQPSVPDRENTIIVLGNRNVPYIREGIKKYVFPTLDHLSKTFDGLEVVLLGRGTMEIPDAFGDVVRQPGWVDDYTREVAKGSVAIVPDPIGSGIKNRTVQSMALGLPVIGTRYAFEGIKVDPELVGCKIDTASDVQTSIESLLANPEMRSAMGERGKKFANDNYNPDNIMASWRSLYHRISD